MYIKETREAKEEREKRRKARSGVCEKERQYEKK